MRKLMWLALGIALMCGAVAYLNSLAVACIGLVALVFGVGAWIVSRKDKKLRILVVICIGLIVGLVICSVYERVHLSKAREMDEQVVHLRAHAEDYSFETQRGCAVRVETDLDGRKVKAQLYLDRDFKIKPGDEIEGAFLLQYTGSEDRSYHFGEGVYLLGYQQEGVYIKRGETIPLPLYPAVIRQKTLQILDAQFSGETAVFAKALLLGERVDLDYVTKTAFKLTGISHIIAVSGMHVSMLASIMYILAGKRRGLMALLGVPAVFLFAAVAGFTPSVTRACIMQILLLMAMLLDRDYDPMTALAVAALVMLVANPMVITSVSFQLSFGCMAGIFLFSSWIYQRLSEFSFWRDAKKRSMLLKIRVWIAGSMSITLGTMVFTVPLCAVHFRTVSLVGIFANLAVLWLVSIIFPGVILVCVASLLHPAFGGIVAMGIGGLIQLLLWIIRWFARFPLAAVFTTSGHVILWLVLCYLALLAFWITGMKRGVVLTCFCVGSLCVSLLAAWAVPASSHVRMTVLDVGQGQCVILTAGGRTFLIDCGGDYEEDVADLAAQTLLSQGIFRLDGVILTHFDDDHAAALPYFLSRIAVEKIYVSDANQDVLAAQRIMALTDQHIVSVQKDIRLTWDDCTLDIFGPVLSNSDNESGISVLFRRGNCDILITGDMNALGERLLLERKQLPKLEALVVGHHGSEYSTCQELLDATMPEEAFISVGKKNTFGHPAVEVLERLESIGCRIHRTDQNGTIIFRR